MSCLSLLSSSRHVLAHRFAPISDLSISLLVLYAVFNVHVLLSQNRRASLARNVGLRSHALQPDYSGDGEIRTHDPLLARQVLSQLSYTPI